MRLESRLKSRRPGHNPAPDAFQDSVLSANVTVSSCLPASPTRLKLKPDVIAALSLETSAPRKTKTEPPGIAVSDLTGDLLDPIVHRAILSHHTYQYCRDLLVSLDAQVTPIWTRAAGLPRYRHNSRHRVDDPDAARPQLALDSRDICRGLSWTHVVPHIIKRIVGQDNDPGPFRDSTRNARKCISSGLSPNSSVYYMNLGAPCTQQPLQHGWPHFGLGNVTTHRTMAESHDLCRRKVDRCKNDAGNGKGEDPRIPTIHISSVNI
jgi:hypothetical protein